MLYSQCLDILILMVYLMLQLKINFTRSLSFDAIYTALCSYIPNLLLIVVIRAMQSNLTDNLNNIGFKSTVMCVVR